VDELYEVTKEPHDGEPNSYSLADLSEFFLRGLCATDKELVSVTDEFLWDLSELSELFRHGERA